MLCNVLMLLLQGTRISRGTLESECSKLTEVCKRGLKRERGSLGEVEVEWVD